MGQLYYSTVSYLLYMNINIVDYIVCIPSKILHENDHFSNHLSPDVWAMEFFVPKKFWHQHHAK